VEKEIREMGGDVAIIACDVTKEEDNRRLASLAVEKFGAINLVLPFAGITKDALMLSIDRDTGKVTNKMSLEQFQSVIDINLTGTFLTVRECAEQMINLGCKGLLCLMSSTCSLGTAGQINYSPAKAGISAMAKVITAEFFRRNVAHQVRCVAIAPGYCDTTMVSQIDKKVLDRILEQIPIKRFIEPQEVASLVGELYRNEACAGEVFYISGGVRFGSRG
jgi:3-oxoacyl-[acyl-carrier protein] reductase